MERNKKEIELYAHDLGARLPLAFLLNCLEEANRISRSLASTIEPSCESSDHILIHTRLLIVNRSRSVILIALPEPTECLASRWRIL